VIKWCLTPQCKEKGGGKTGKQRVLGGGGVLVWWSKGTVGPVSAWAGKGKGYFEVVGAKGGMS